MYFAPGIDILSLLDRFLSDFEKSHFLKFSFVGFRHFRAGRIFYMSRITRKSAGIPSTTLTPFPKKNGAHYYEVFSDLHQNMCAAADSPKTGQCTYKRLNC